ncbi:MAG: HAMP domain-containing sensor histidine kinase [bacterium]|nr:HAMP domain-containing sensor histidine kinase [bacterium]
MISKLKKNLTILLSALFCVLYIGGLVMFNWGKYESCLMDLRRQVRLEVSEVGLKQIENSHGAALELDALDYSIFHVKKKDAKVELYSNHLPDIDEQTQYEYAQKIADNWKKPMEFWRITNITKQGKSGRYVVLISVYPAVRAVIPTVVASIGLALVGMLLLILLTNLLSKRMVRPVEQTLSAEKKFMSNASHELKTPLTVISTNAQLLEQEIGENRHLVYIRQETDQMIEMVNKMLTLMHLDAPVEQTVFKRFRADEAVFDVIFPMESIAYEKKLTLESEVEEGMELTGDENQIRQLLTILLDNAITYTPEGGVIRIIASVRMRRFQLSVTNTGDEIPKEQQERLFERFYRADEARVNDGSHFGLGLSIAGSIVANHHGKIWVESKDGQNTFRVLMPSGK